MAFQGTPAAEQTEVAIRSRFSHLFSSIGQYNRRYIGGTRIWSQHAYGNALDIMVGYKNYAAGDVIYAWLVKHKEELGIRTILWRVTAHHDHIHIDFWPRGVYTPSTSSTGVCTFRYSDGRQVSNRIQLISPERVWKEAEVFLSMLRQTKIGDRGEHVETLQIMLKSSGFDPGDLDGVYGPKTSAALLDCRKAQGSQASTGDVFSNWAYDQLLRAHAKKAVGKTSSGTVDSTARAAAAGAQAAADKANTRLNKAKAAL